MKLSVLMHRNSNLWNNLTLRSWAPQTQGPKKAEFVSIGLKLISLRHWAMVDPIAWETKLKNKSCSIKNGTNRLDNFFIGIQVPKNRAQKWPKKLLFQLILNFQEPMSELKLQNIFWDRKGCYGAQKWDKKLFSLFDISQTYRCKSVSQI